MVCGEHSLVASLMNFSCVLVEGEVIVDCDAKVLKPVNHLN